ncbi:hypothetical protein FH972_020364 [Carpinus fangiana]|uniref:Cytochrome P450 n=1 Tax=Carpinus fangiana TaxID=176857 RepID=A0A5N6RW80_9ROSI|nr:hypothetical protein FH972_020364 [Carpinus fangiana]
MILGDRNIFELSGEDHKRVRSALVSFLKPESLKQYVGKMDGEVKEHLEMHWQGKQQVEREARRDKFVACFQEMLVGMWVVPVNLPFTRYNRGLKASATVQNMVKDFIIEKIVELEQKGASPHQDLITCLFGIRKDDNEEALTENEIVHNVMLVMVAGHDTSSVLMTFIMRLLANEPAVYAAVLQEHEEIAKTKPSGEYLTWEDLTKMKFTWRVAMETLRMVPPVFGGFRKGGNSTQVDSRAKHRFQNPAYSFVAFGGVERGARRDKFVACFQEMLVGMWVVPVNLPFTRYNRGLKASATVQNMVKDLIIEKRVELEQKGASPHQDLITCLLSIRKEDNEEALTENEIVHNVMLVMVAGHDTSSLLMTFIMRLLANEHAVYAAVLQEHEEIAKTKPSGEYLTWEDLTKMKFTWRVAMETLRMVPPVFGGFRKGGK